MKKFPILAAAALLLFSQSGFCKPDANGIEGPKTTVNATWTKHPSGLEYTVVSFHIGDNAQTISAVRADLRKFRLEVASEVGREACDSTSALCKRYGAQAAINGSYFHVKKYIPTTFIKDDGAVEGVSVPSEHFRVNGVLMISSNGKITIEVADSASVEGKSDKSREAVAAGPVLVSKGKHVTEGWGEKKFFTGRHPRSIVGTDGKWVYLIVADGRFPGQAVGLTIEETAQVADLFNLDYALNLDGGGSSTLYVEGAGVINHPYDNHKFDHFGQRIVPNVLLLFPKK